jgi:hypothetical protein
MRNRPLLPGIGLLVVAGVAATSAAAQTMTAATA